ncbi:MAG: cytochrome c3 family protein [Anaerolineaceae bacterium]|nr:cytochrome c3 family protein [Anaerolineaceae bacterium]
MESSQNNMIYRRTILKSLFTIILISVLCTLNSTFVFAEADPGKPAPQPDMADNDECLACHDNSEMRMSFPSGDELLLEINASIFSESVHGESGVLCTDCHPGISEYPHPEVIDLDYREYQLEYQNICADCHEDMGQLRTDSVHFKALEKGDRYSAICSDCHNPHSQGRILDDEGNVLEEGHLEIPQTCAQCHNAIYEEYADSVHGAALLKANLDVPTCIDCHDVHIITDPDSSEFHLGTVDTCTECHINEEIMGKYDISTQVLTTYVADFHGTTITLFEKEHPEAGTNKPVCYDCHGYHDILAADDPEKGLQVKENMLVVCQKCHPNATDEFPDTWLSHYIPDPEHYPLVYYVDLFYKIFVAVVLGGMGFFVATDIYRRIRTRKQPSENIQE